MTLQVQTNDSFTQAFEHHQAGRKTRAESLYRKILENDPFHDKALYLLGIIALENSRNEEAIDLLTRATQVAPHMPAYYTNLGVALRRFGQNTQAVEALRMAVLVKPDFPEAHYNLGLSLINVNDLESAQRALERAVDLKPDDYDMQRHFARLLQMRGELTRAIGHYHAAMVLVPGSWDCFLELLNILRTLRRLEAAAALARRAVTRNPDSPIARNELGAILLKTEQLDEAFESLRIALRLDPHCAEAYANLGIALGEIGLGNEGIENSRKALALRPGWHWTKSNVIFMMMFIPGVEESAILEEARSWDQTYAAPLRSNLPAYENRADANRRLRIGYVSPHFSAHCQSFFTTPLFQNHDRNQFEIFCYSSVDFRDDHTERLNSLADGWREVSQSDDAEVAEMVRRDGIDILVDLTMHMEKSGLLIFARKPAPVQISWLAYPGTTGVQTIDYRITDRYIDPLEAGPGPYSERSLVLPDTFWCYDPLTTKPEPSALPAIANGFITFGCLNHFRKVNEGVLEVWSEVLRTVSTSRLIMLVPDGEARQRTLEFLRKRSIDPGRIVFLPRLGRSDYLQAYREIDICLDSFPYGGHTTSLDAFWMGVPVVSLMGPTVVGRAGLTIATNLGLGEFVAKTPAEFVAAANTIASDLQSLQELRQGLRARMQGSFLMDYARFTRNMEAAYRTAWRIWCEGGSTDRAPIFIEPA